VGLRPPCRSDKNSQVPSDTQCAALCSPPAQQAALTVTSRCGMRHHVRYHTGAARQGASGFVDQPGQSREPELSPRTSTECSILLPAALVTAHARAMQPQAARRTPVAHHRATKTCRPDRSAEYAVVLAVPSQCCTLHAPICSSQRSSVCVRASVHTRLRFSWHVRLCTGILSRPDSVFAAELLVVLPQHSASCCCVVGSCFCCLPRP